ncbi:MAG: hypothetical protein VX346_01700, partial [Planctomycetota bacterium]|nr:hypothetical protein [Planctomycetota bacterium]
GKAPNLFPDGCGHTLMAGIVVTVQDVLRKRQQIEHRVGLGALVVGMHTRPATTYRLPAPRKRRCGRNQQSDKTQLRE